MPGELHPGNELDEEVRSSGSLRSAGTQSLPTEEPLEGSIEVLAVVIGLKQSSSYEECHDSGSEDVGGVVKHGECATDEQRRCQYQDGKGENFRCHSAI